MNECICQIVPVYLRPQPLTDEKACIGVIVRCPELSFADYRIVESGSAAAERIANFFPRLGRDDVNRVLEWARHDISYSLSPASEEEAEKRFMNLIRPRENIVQYGAPQIGITRAPSEDLSRAYRLSVAQD